LLPFADLICRTCACVRAAISLIFSFTNGAEWDGPYTLKFRVPKPWQNKPLSFFNEVGVVWVMPVQAWPHGHQSNSND
jgi:hypothetical protein